MKSLHLNDLKKNEAVPDSYEIAVAYKGRKVEIILDNYAYTLQQLLETANNVLVYLPTLDEKAKKYLAHQNIDCFNECNEKKWEARGYRRMLRTHDDPFGYTIF
ncbi:hypothetical protein [Capnocytophaga granulosa]